MSPIQGISGIIRCVVIVPGGGRVPLSSPHESEIHSEPLPSLASSSSALQAAVFAGNRENPFCWPAPTATECQHHCLLLLPAEYPHHLLG